MHPLSRSLSVTTVAVTAALLVPLSLAIAAPADGQLKHAKEMNEAYYRQLNDGGLMIGYISLASMAIENGVLDVASADVGEALKVARNLEKGAPTFNSKDRMSFGKLTHDHDNTVRDFYIPIVDEDFMVHDFGTSHAAYGKYRETDARMIHSHATLDVRKAVSGLNEAKAALERNDGKAAEQALNGILKAAVAEDIVSRDPLHVVHDNLVLAEDLVREKRYDGARYALKYAKSGLKDYKPHGKERQEHVAQMQKDIDALSEELSKEDPSLLDRAGTKIKGWVDEVDQWLVRHAPHEQPPPPHLK